MANQQDANETPTHEGEYKEEIHNKQRKKRRPRIRKNKEITIATINVRGIKGKIKSLETTLNTEKISIALITETQLKKNEQISVKGYRWIHKPRPNNNGGGVGILVAEKIAQNTTEDISGEDHDQLETKWIKLECRPKNIAIGVFYGPQENKKIEKVKEIYTALNNQIAQKAQTNEIIIAGDYNAKLLIDTDNHKQSESRNGKLLKDPIANNNLTPINLKPDHGMWTRVNRKKGRRKISYRLYTHHPISDQKYSHNHRGWRRKTNNQREEWNWPQHNHDIPKNQRPQNTNIPRKMEAQQQRRLDRIQQNSQNKIQRTQTENWKLQTSWKRAKENTDENNRKEKIQNW